MSLNKKKTIVMLVPFVITFIIALIALILGNFEPFGKNNVLSTYEGGSNIINFYNIYDLIRDNCFSLIGNSTGLYHDNISDIAYYFSDPTNWIILLFPRFLLPTIFNFLYVIKLGLASSFFAYFLLYINSDLASTKSNTTNKDDEAKDKNRFVVMGDYKPKGFVSSFIYDNLIIWALSLSYALSASFLIVGMNLSYTSAMALLPLVIVGLLEIIKKQHIKKFVIFYSISFYLNLHITFISTIFILLFFITRNFNGVKHFITSLYSLVKGLLLSILFASPIILNTMHSPLIRANYNNAFPLFRISNPLDYLKQLFPSSSPSILSLYLNNVDIYFCFISVMCLFLSFFNKSIKLSERIKDSFLYILILLSITTSTFKHLFNALLITDNILYSYIIAFVGIYITYKTLYGINKQTILSVNIASLITAILIISCMIFSTMYDSSAVFIYSLELLFVYYLLISVYVSKSLNKYLFILITSLFILLEISIVMPNEMKKLGNSLYSKSLSHTLKYEYYDISRIIKKQDPSSSICLFSGDCNEYDISIISMLGYDYIIANTSGKIAPLVDATNINNKYQNITVFKNNYAIKTAYFPKEITNIYYDKVSPFLTYNDVSRLVSGNDIYSSIENDIDFETSYDNKYVNFSVMTKESGSVYFKGYYVSYLGDVKKGDTTNVVQSVPEPSYEQYYYQVYLFDEDSFINTCRKIMENTNNTEAKLGEKHCYTFPDNGYLKTNYIYDKSISYYVNGKHVKPIKFYNQIAIIPVNKGNNTIQIKYNPIYIIMSFINILIAISLVLWRGKNNDK